MTVADVSAAQKHETYYSAIPLQRSTCTNFHSCYSTRAWKPPAVKILWLSGDKLEDEIAVAFELRVCVAAALAALITMNVTL